MDEQSTLKSVILNLTKFFSRAPMDVAQLSAKSIWTDAQVQAIRKLLIEKKIFTQEEYTNESHKLAKNYEEQIITGTENKL